MRPARDDTPLSTLTWRSPNLITGPGPKQVNTSNQLLAARTNRVQNSIPTNISRELTEAVTLTVSQTEVSRRESGRGSPEGIGEDALSSNMDLMIDASHATPSATLLARVARRRGGEGLPDTLDTYRGAMQY